MQLLILFTFFMNFAYDNSTKDSDNYHLQVIKGFEQLEPTLHKKNDTIYIINFWATWCTPCRKELPAFEKINEQYSSQKVKVILVSLDMPNLIEINLLPFIRKNKLKSEIVLLDDPRQHLWIDKVDTTWSGALPFTLIYGQNFRETYERTFQYSELDSIIKQKQITP